MIRTMLVLALALSACATAPARQEHHAAAPAPAKAEVAPESHAGMQPPLADATGAKKVFDQKPMPGEKALCAVSGEAFTITEETKVAEHNGKYYAFCCDDCEPEFKSNPGKYTN